MAITAMATTGTGNNKTGGADPAVTDNNGSAYGNTNNTGGSQNRSGILFPESGKVSSIEQELIDLIRTSGKEKNYELIEYVNDVNRQYTETLMELNENGYLDTAYTYGNERLSADRFEGSSYYYLYEGRGSVSAVTGTDGYFTASYRYNAYGEMTFGKPQYENVYGYNGESYNPNLNGQYLRARYYHVEMVNFFTEDSYLGNIRESLSLNRYNYVHSNPENYRDPSGHFVITLTSLAIAAGVGAITGVTFSAIEQYSSTGTVTAGTTVKAAFIGATGGVVGVATAGIVGVSLAGAGLGTTFSSTLAVGGVQGLTTGIAVRSNTEILNSAFAQFEGKPNQISIEDSISRIFHPASMTTDAIAGGVAEGLLYMANSAAIKNQAQICAEGEISKNAKLDGKFSKDVTSEGMNALEKLNIDDVYVKTKHLSSTAGHGAKFSATTRVEAERELKSALKKKIIKAINYDGISARGNQKYSVYLDAGKTIGTSGESTIKIVISDDGGLLSAYPVKK
jgi:RHS repeat-associated protein